MGRSRHPRLFWRVFALDATLFTIVALALLLTPVTISAPVAVAEALTVLAGLVVVLALNAAVLWSAFAPLERLARRMEVVDLLRPGQRLEVGPGDEIGRVVRAFNHMLDRLETERRLRGQHLLDAQEAERVAIARDLHDEVGQLLTGVLLELDAAAKAPHTPSRLDSATSSVRQALEEVRRISQSLRPQMLEELGLVSALIELCTKLERATGATVRRSFFRPAPELDPTVELVLYRIVQEALTNVARHAQATQVQVELASDGSELTLRVADDGVGIGPDDERSGGMRGMRERALLVNAVFSVERRDEGGTEVRLVMPLATPPELD